MGFNVMYGRNLVYGKGKGPYFTSVIYNSYSPHNTDVALILPSCLHQCSVLLVFPTPETVRGILFGITWDDKRYL